MDNRKNLADVIAKLENVVYGDMSRTDTAVLVDASLVAHTIGYLRSQFNFLYDYDYDSYVKFNGLNAVSKVYPDGDESILVMVEDFSCCCFVVDLSRKQHLKQSFKENVDLEHAKELARVIRESHDWSECQDEIEEFLGLANLPVTDDFESQLEYVGDMLDLEIYCSWSGGLYNTLEGRDEYREFMEDPANYKNCDLCPENLRCPYEMKCSKCLVEPY